jgi:hypothetical protein
MERNLDEGRDSPRIVTVSSLRSRPADAGSRGPVGVVAEAQLY